jgi:hypothetical protein
MTTVLTESQIVRWRRVRAKGRARVLLEQWLAWTVGVGMGGPTLRALVRGGGDAARAYWRGGAAGVHLALAILFGAVMTYFFGLVSWNRMERLYAEATVRAADASGTKGKSGGDR